MKFYDRKDELAELSRIQNLSFTNHSRFTVITGRRRIGKTYLIKKACEGTPTVYLFVSRDNEAVLVKRFISEIKETLQIFIPEEINSFRTLFTIILETGKTQHFNLIIDEFQELLYVNQAIFSHIQDIWDRYKDITHVNFIVSGSAYHLMNKIFEDRKEPLFGRRDSLICLEPFKTNVLKDILSDYNPSYSTDDLLALYTFTGGVPKYIEILMDNSATNKDLMLKEMIRANSLFLSEGKNILIEEFGKDYTTYFSILGCISTGINTQSAIENTLGGVSIGGNLKRLIQDYNLISRIRPFAAKESSKGVRYEISDNFLHLWFKYIHKNRSIVELGNWQLLHKIIADDYNTYTGIVLERYFRQQMKESMKYRAIANWWDPKNTDNQHEIDIIALTADNKTAEIYEVKRNPDRYRKDLLADKIEYLKSKVKDIKRYKVIMGCLSMEDM